MKLTLNQVLEIAKIENSSKELSKPAEFLRFDLSTVSDNLRLKYYLDRIKKWGAPMLVPVIDRKAK